MANTLKMAEVYTIYALLGRGWSRRRIAQVLGIDRDTVTRYARLAAATPGGAPPGAPLGCGPPKPATAPPGSATTPAAAELPARSMVTPAAVPATAVFPGSALAAEHRSLANQSGCEPFRVVILAKLQQGLSAKRIHQDLVAEHGFSGEYESVRRALRTLNQDQCGPVRRDLGVEILPQAAPRG